MTLNTQENQLDQALAEARLEGAKAERRRARRRLLIAWVTCATLLIMGIVAARVLVVQARDNAPSVISQMVSERRAALEERLSLRASEARALVGELFDFGEALWVESESLRQIQENVAGAQAQLSLLDAEVRAALGAPLSQLPPLLKNGPTRARQLAEHLVVVAGEIRRLIPTVFHALGDAQKAFAQSPEGATIAAVLVSMDALIEPFVGQNERLRARWHGLKKEMLDWAARVEADLALTRMELSGDGLGDEFVDRLVQRLF